MKNISLVQRDLSVPTSHVQDMSHRGEGQDFLVISQFSHNLPVSLNNKNTATCLLLSKLSKVCPSPMLWGETGAVARRRFLLTTHHLIMRVMIAMLRLLLSNYTKAQAQAQVLTM